jgi:nucleoside 2-deoxyribosyltransferase
MYIWVEEVATSNWGRRAHSCGRRNVRSRPEPSPENPGMTRPRLYLAGPDVFRPDAIAHGHRLVALCAERGFEGLYPLDNDFAFDPDDLPGMARRIYQANLARIDACDAVVANLDFFRGPEPDSGTCFEVGYAVDRGKPVVGYLPEGGSFAQRIRARHPHAVRDGEWDAQGWRLEEFGLPLNLMLGVPCRVVVGGFEQALRGVREWLATG